jgi:hypothetical protein
MTGNVLIIYKELEENLLASNSEVHQQIQNVIVAVKFSDIFYGAENYDHDQVNCSFHSFTGEDMQNYRGLK